MSTTQTLAPPALTRATPRADDRTFLSWVAIFVALAALVLGFVALSRLGDGDGGPGGAGAESGEATVIDVELGALSITPAEITAPPGRVTLRVTNIDSQVHNLSLMGQRTPDLEEGESAELDLGELDVGVYSMLCEIAGHADGGMRGNLNVVAGATAGAAAEAPATETAPADEAAVDHFHGHGSASEMQAAMDARALRFVQEPKGTFGGRPLEPTVAPDGTKVFEVTAEIVDWEVEPGKVVQAWTYNGTVPAPSIHVEVGDRVRVNFTNNLPTGSVIHWHGIRVPNAMDGVPPFTQPAVLPGESFTYEFEALEPAVGIYHSHNGADQVLDGLFGVFTIGSMPVPEVLVEQGYNATPEQSINMILNDAGVIGLSLNGKSFPATEPYTAKVGDTLLVHYYNEGLLAHPMHMHQPLGWIIAKDGKPLLTPIPGDTINIGPGERYTVLYKMVDPGVWAWHCHILTHAERDDGMFGMVTAVIVEE